MPGYIMHLACAERVLKHFEEKDEIWKNQFRLGSIVADTCDKRESHFWDDEMYKRFDRSPNLDMFLKKYNFYMEHPFVYGYYAHLYLDYMFVTEYWQKHFAFFDENRVDEHAYEKVFYVLLKDTDTWYKREDFFSDKLYYGDYDLMNQYMKDTFNVKLPFLNPQSLVGFSDNELWNEASLIKAFEKIPIQEIQWEKAVPGLKKMLDKLEELNQKDKETFTPPLNIFILSDLVSMIEIAAKEIARRNA